METKLDSETIEWLLESDPAIRWQTLRDLSGASASEVIQAREEIATDGWGAELLALQDPKTGLWDGGVYRPGWVDEERPYYDAWTSTHFSIAALREFGLDPQSEPAKRAIGLVRDQVTWDGESQGYFKGETEPCINGIVLANGAYFQQDVSNVLDRVLADQLEDGGWNCWAEYGAKVSSVHSTLCVLEGLAEWQRSGENSESVEGALHRGEEFLLRRELYKRESTGEVIDPRFTMFSYPTRWYYDVLRALDYFRARGLRDQRCSNAIELVRKKQDSQGLWLLENSHQGPTLIELEGVPDGFPSKWNTLRASRVLLWWDGAAA